MKRLAFIVFLMAALGATGQENLNLGIIPTPQRIEKGEGTCVLEKAKVKEQKVADLPADANKEQAYRLIVEPKRITLQYIDDKGLENGLQTLEMLMALHTSIPCVTITDWPAYKWRGWMDDISRGPVTHEKYRRKQWETLHKLKYNFCTYYTEHTLYQPEFPDLAPAYADCQRLPDEVTNLQLFAHAEKTLRVPFYQEMMDSKANFNPDNEKTYDFLRKRIAEAMRQTPSSPFFIINCDETEQLGTGRAKNLVEKKGGDQVYIDHLNRCCQIIKEEDKNPQPITPVMWGDIVAKNPEMMKQLPDNMVYIMWAYEPLESYAHLIKPFKEQGNPFWVAPSLSHSGNMMPNPHRYMKNIANLARDGWKNGAEGLMNTCWDDNGEALFDNCWHGLYWSAEMAWNPLKSNDPEEYRQREYQFNLNFARLFYGERTTDKVDQLYDLGAIENDPELSEWYTSAALMEPLLNFNPFNTGEEMLDRIGRLDSLLSTINVDSSANPHAHYAKARIHLSLEKAALRYVINKALNGEVSLVDFLALPSIRNDYFTHLHQLKCEYLRLWDQENGDYERYIVLNRYDDLAREVLDLDRHVFMSVSKPADGSQWPLVTLRTLDEEATIYYTLDGSEPTMASAKYSEPIKLEHSATVRTIVYNEYGEGVESREHLLSHTGMGADVTFGTKYDSGYKSIYSGGGDNALNDGVLGSNATYADGHWQGYWGKDIDMTLDFGSERDIHCIDARFMQNSYDWILGPKGLLVYVSKDGKDWKLAKSQDYSFDPRETGMRLRHCHVTLDSAVKSRYIKVVATNGGLLPEWHTAPGQPSWLFCDEIVVK